MKPTYILAVLIFLFSATGFSQDTTHYKVLQKVNVNKNTRDSLNSNYKLHLHNPPHIIYRDTRLGSSSPLYNTYKKNDYGAGAVTTNPNKSGRSFIDNSANNYLDSLETTSKDSIPPKKD